ncbi:MAG: TolC family protein [Magnetococcales bacterium]|nr:TolC family protein [Magnetococcales bacterium]MBF0116477.1 TolC family protein [Magnetococcales bacterium]
MLPFLSTISIDHQDRCLWRNERFWKVLLLGFLYCSALDTRSAWSITLTEAVTTTLAISPEVLVADKQRLITEQQVKQAFAGYLPSIDFSTSAGNEKTNSLMTRSVGRGTVSLPYREARTTFNQQLPKQTPVRILQTRDGWMQELIGRVARDGQQGFLFPATSCNPACSSLLHSPMKPCHPTTFCLYVRETPNDPIPTL